MKAQESFEGPFDARSGDRLAQQMKMMLERAMGSRGRRMEAREQLLAGLRGVFDVLHLRIMRRTDRYLLGRKDS